MELHLALSTLKQYWELIEIELIRSNYNTNIIIDEKVIDSESLKNFSYIALTGLNNDYYQQILDEMMERVSDLQRRYYGRTLDEWVNNKQLEYEKECGFSPQKSKPYLKTEFGSNQTKKSEINNVYDTVADALDSGQNGGQSSHRRDTPPTPPPKPKLRNINDNLNTPNRAYNRPADLPDVDNHNLDKRKKDIEKWLRSMENRITEISYYYVNKSPSSLLNNIDKTNDKKPLSNSIDSMKSEETPKNISTQIYQLEVGIFVCCK